MGTSRDEDLRKDWVPVKIADEEIAEKWKKFNTRVYKDKTSTKFYCSFGKFRCPARMRKDVYHKYEKIEYLSNGLSHDHSADRDENYGLTQAQKEFVLNAPVQKPKDILRLFRLEGVTAPETAKLRGFLQRHRRNVREMNAKGIRDDGNPRAGKKPQKKTFSEPRLRSNDQDDNSHDHDDHFDDSEPIDRSPSPFPEPTPSSRRTLRSVLKKPQGKPYSVSGDKLMSLEWEDQLDHLQKALGSMYEDATGAQVLTDVTLVSSEEEIVEAHQFVLSMCSPYFRRLFKKVQGSKRAAGSTLVILDNVKTSHLKNLLQFCYIGQVDIPSSDEPEIQKLGDLFEIQGLISCLKSKSRTGESKEKKCDLRDPSGNPNKNNDDGEVSSNYQLRTRSAERKPYQEEEEDDDSQNDDETAADHFDDFHALVSEDEEELHSEPEIKVERAQSPDPVTENAGDSDHSPYLGSSDEIEKSDGEPLKGESGINSKEGPSSKNGQVITLKVKKLSRPKKEETSSEPLINPKTGILETEEDRRRNRTFPWAQIEPLPSDVLKENFAFLHKRYRKNRSMYYVMYYCRHSYKKRCPVLLKMEFFCGKRLWYLNGLEHANHRSAPFHRGLSVEQKNLIDSLVRKNIRTPQKVKEAMEAHGGVPVPARCRIHNYLSRQRAQLLEKVEALTGVKVRRNGKKGRPPKEESLEGVLLSTSSKSVTRPRLRLTRNSSAASPSASSQEQTNLLVSPLLHPQSVAVATPSAPPIPLGTYPHPMSLTTGSNSVHYYDGVMHASMVNSQSQPPP